LATDDPQQKANNQAAKTMHTPTPPTTPEAVLAARLNVPRDSFKRWREGGNLKRLLHYIKDGHAYHLTPEGEAEVMRLIGLGETLPTGPAKILMLAQAAGVMPRVLRCKPVAGGALVSVRLTAPRVFAAQFRRGDRLEVTPTETEGIFEYDGPVPRRTRI
jgi:hypothetical protein